MLQGLDGGVDGQRQEAVAVVELVQFLVRLQVLQNIAQIFFTRN